MTSEHTKTTLRFLLIPALIFAMLEFKFRSEQQTSWFNNPGQTLALTEAGDSRIILVGNSLTAAAVPPRLLADTLEAETGHYFTVLNFGHAFCQDVHVYYGLKRMLKNAPHCLERTVVLIQAMGGVPFSHTKFGSIRGCDLDEVTLLAPYLEASDVPRLLNGKYTDWRSKRNLIAAETSYFLTNAPQWLPSEKRRLDAQADLLLYRLTGVPPKPVFKHDVIEEGGVRADDEGVRMFRGISLNLVHKILATQCATNSWDDTFLRATVQLVQSSGGRVVFFDVPVSPVQSLWAVSSPAMIENRKLFSRIATEWHCEMVQPQYSASNSDYPDLSHPARTEALRYTVRLGRMLASSLK